MFPFSWGRSDVQTLAPTLSLALSRSQSAEAFCFAAMVVLNSSKYMEETCSSDEVTFLIDGTLYSFLLLYTNCSLYWPVKGVCVDPFANFFGRKKQWYHFPVVPNNPSSSPQQTSKLGTSENQTMQFYFQWTCVDARTLQKSSRYLPFAPWGLWILIWESLLYSTRAFWSWKSSQFWHKGPGQWEVGT